MQQNDLAFFDQLLAQDQPPVWDGIDESDFVAQTPPEDGPSITAPRFFQPFDGAVILRDGEEPWWGGGYVDGIYYGSIGAAERAQCITLERAHIDALREERVRRQLRVLANWYLTQKTVDSPTRAATEISRAVRNVVGRALSTEHRELLAKTLTNIVRNRTRFELTDRGRQELQRSSEVVEAAVEIAARVG